jgi:hypothetical protein
MRPKKRVATGAGDLFRSRIDQIINLDHELVQLAERIDWDWLDGEIAPLYSVRVGRPGMRMLQSLYNLSDEQIEHQVRERMSFPRFLGIGFEDDIPDDTTLACSVKSWRRLD